MHKAVSFHICLLYENVDILGCGSETNTSKYVYMAD